MKLAPLLLLLALLLASPARADDMSMQTDDTLARLPDAGWTVDAAAHLLRRAGFGGSIEDAERLHAMGLDRAVDALLDWEGRPDPSVPSPKITLTARPDRAAYRAAGSEEERQKLRRQYRRADYMQMAAVREWWMQVMLRTEHPLRERLTLFWHGHFTSGHRDVRNSYHMYLQNTLLRRHAAGSFRDLLHAVSKDPAMLEYLDNRQNRKGHPNENYAREVMELFTLGVGNYTEDDIKEAARALSGWTFAGNRFVDNKGQHDDGAKTIFGKTGNFDGDQFLELLLAQEAAPRHIADRVFRYFAHDYPNDAVIGGLARTLARNDWEMRPMLRQLFRSQAFYGKYARGTQVKSPVVLLVSLVRSLEMNPDVMIGASVLAAQLGQNLMDPPNVKGWPGGRDWINTSILFERYNLCATLVGEQRDKTQGINRKNAGQMARMRRIMEMREEGMEMGGDMADGVRNRRRRRPAPLPTYDVLKTVRAKDLDSPEAIVDHFCRTLFAVDVDPKVRATLLEYLKQDGGYPQRVRARRTRLHGMLRLLVSTPEFQLN